MQPTSEAWGNLTGSWRKDETTYKAAEGALTYSAPSELDQHAGISHDPGTGEPTEPWWCFGFDCPRPLYNDQANYGILPHARQGVKGLAQVVAMAENPADPPAPDEEPLIDEAAGRDWDEKERLFRAIAKKRGVSHEAINKVIQQGMAGEVLDYWIQQGGNLRRFLESGHAVKRSLDDMEALINQSDASPEEKARARADLRRIRAQQALEDLETLEHTFGLSLEESEERDEGVISRVVEEHYLAQMRNLFPEASDDDLIYVGRFIAACVADLASRDDDSVLAFLLRANGLHEDLFPSWSEETWEAVAILALATYGRERGLVPEDLYRMVQPKLERFTAVEDPETERRQGPTEK